MSWNERRLLRLPLQFFAEGSEGGGADGEGASVEGAGTELSQDDLFLAEMEQKYGITDGVATAEARLKVNAKDKDGSLESEEADAEKNTADANAENENAAISPDEEFDALIKGKYKEQYGKRVQSAISERFKANADMKSENVKLRGMASIMAGKYGLNEDDFDGIIAAMEGDDDLYEAEALREDLTTAEVKQRNKDKKDKKASEDEISRLRSEIDARDAKDRARADVLRWQQESKDTVTKYESFDLRSEIKNPEFLSYLQAGKTVTEAYELTHMHEIMDARVAAAEKRAREDATRAVAQNRARIKEGARSPHSTPQSRIDLRNMTDEEFEKIEKLVNRGVRVGAEYFK